MDKHCYIMLKCKPVKLSPTLRDGLREKDVNKIKYKKSLKELPPSVASRIRDSDWCIPCGENVTLIINEVHINVLCKTVGEI